MDTSTTDMPDSSAVIIIIILILFFFCIVYCILYTHMKASQRNHISFENSNVLEYPDIVIMVSRSRQVFGALSGKTFIA
jgi:flagellar basal body-associated protein FliL